MNLWRRIQLVHRNWRYRLRTERQEIAFTRSAIGRGQCVLDIGAHKAAFTYWMAKAAGPGGCVIAFEPNPHLAGYLQQVATCFRVGQLRVVPVALSNKQGMAKLHFPGQHLGSASLELKDDVLRPPIEVTTTTLDDYLSSIGLDKPISFIKCDVESHELAVFEGATQTLRNHRPVLLFESGDFTNEPDRYKPVFQLLAELGFVGYFFCDSRLVPVADYRPEMHRLRDDDHQNYVFAHPQAIELTRLTRPYRIQRIDQRYATRNAA